MRCPRCTQRFEEVPCAVFDLSIYAETSVQIGVLGKSSKVVRNRGHFQIKSLNERGKFHMRENDHAVLGEMQICLESMSACLDGGFKGKKRILWIFGFVASMRDYLW